MTKQHSLDHFLSTFAETLHESAISRLEDHIENNHEEIIKGIVESFRRLFIRIAESGKEAGFIVLSLLRTDLKAGGVNCLLSAYDNMWYLDQEAIEEYYDAGWVLGHFNEYGHALDTERKRYVGKVTKYDAEKVKWDRLDAYKGYLLVMLRKAMEQVTGLDEYKDIKKSAVLDIRAGEYYDLTESVWLEDNAGTSEEEIWTFLKQKYENHYIYRHYKDIDLSSGDYAEVNFIYSRFERVDLSDCLMSGCLLVGAKFISCGMARADLRGSVIWTGDFSDSDLKDADLSYANYNTEAYAEKIDTKMYIRTSFRGADLRGANLSFGNFSGCDFRKAKLAGCDLSGAKLTKALIDEKYLNDKSLILTEEQRGEVIWV